VYLTATPAFEAPGFTPGEFHLPSQKSRHKNFLLAAAGGGGKGGMSAVAFLGGR